MSVTMSVSAEDGEHFHIDVPPWRSQPANSLMVSSQKPFNIGGTGVARLWIQHEDKVVAKLTPFAMVRTDAFFDPKREWKMFGIPMSSAQVECLRTLLTKQAVSDCIEFATRVALASVQKPFSFDLANAVPITVDEYKSEHGKRFLERCVHMQTCVDLLQSRKAADAKQGDGLEFKVLHRAIYAGANLLQLFLCKIGAAPLYTLESIDAMIRWHGSDVTHVRFLFRAAHGCVRFEKCGRVVAPDADGVVVCRHCPMVQYCSETCMELDRPVHTNLCGFHATSTQSRRHEHL